MKQTLLGMILCSFFILIQYASAQGPIEAYKSGNCIVQTFPPKEKIRHMMWCQQKGGYKEGYIRGIGAVYLTRPEQIEAKSITIAVAYGFSLLNDSMAIGERRVYRKDQRVPMIFTINQKEIKTMSVSENSQQGFLQASGEMFIVEEQGVANKILEELKTTGNFRVRVGDFNLSFIAAATFEEIPYAAVEFARRVKAEISK